MKRLSHEEVEERIKEEYNGKIELISDYFSKGILVTLKCTKCGEIWDVTGHRVLNGETSCPQCERNLRKKVFCI